MRLVGVCPRAARAGLRADLPLAEAQARLPGLRVERDAPESDRALLRQLADASQRWSPSIAIEPDGSGLRLDAAGIAHLFGGEDGLLADISGRLGNLRLNVRACLADTIGAAWAGARFARTSVANFAPGTMRPTIAGLPVAGLRLAAADVEALRRLGLRRIGDLYPFSDATDARTALAERFGPAVARRLFQALGEIEEPLSPDRPAPALRARLPFAEPVAAPEDIARTVARLARDICARMAQAALGARRLALALHRADGTAARIALGTSRPMRDPAAIERLFAEPIQRFEPAFGIDLATLDAEIVEALPVEQRHFADMLPDGEPAHVAPLAPLVDRLANRLGAANVTRLAHVESHIPERAQARVAALSPLPAILRGARPAKAPRPLRLFAHPEPIDVAAEVPDAPPLLFRWRRLVHHVAVADGPERIADEWWRRTAEPRDYFRLEDREGRRFWVFREGLWTLERARPPRWYLHGLFA